jgi:hypothetical protein
MAQAYEYLTVSDGNAANFVATLATDDAAGWEVIGYTQLWIGGGAAPYVFSALLRRRV